MFLLIFSIIDSKHLPSGTYDRLTFLIPFVNPWEPYHSSYQVKTNVKHQKNILIDTITSQWLSS